MRTSSDRSVSRTLCTLLLGFTALVAWGSPWGVPPERAFPPNPSLRKGVDLLLRVPYDTILYGEIPHIYVGIRNASGAPLRVLEFLDEEERQQLHFEARVDYAGPNLTRPSIYPWDRLIGDGRRLQEIPSGDARIYEYQRADFISTYDPQPRTSREIRVRLLTEGNEWVFSNWVPFKRLDDRRLDDAEIVGVFDNHFGYKVTIRRATIANADYLFADRVRIARIPAQAVLRIAWDLATGLLTVYFDGVNVPPLVHLYNRIRMEKWSPETAPHMIVLEDLKMELGRSGRSATPTASMTGVSQDSVPTAKATKSGLSTAQTSEPRSGITRTWAAVLILLVASLVWLAIRRRRTSAIANEDS